MGNETKPNAAVYQISPNGINTLASIIAKDAAEAVTAVTEAFSAKLDELINKLEAKKAADLPDDFRSGKVLKSDLETAEIQQPVSVPEPMTREHSYQWLIGRLSRSDMPTIQEVQSQRVACIIARASVGDVYPELPAGLTVAEIVRRLERSTSLSNEKCLAIADALVEPPLPEADDEPMAGEEADDWLRDAYRLAYIIGMLANPNTVQGMPWSDVIHNAHRFAEKAVNF